MRVLFCCSGSFGFWVLCQGREVSSSDSSTTISDTNTTTEATTPKTGDNSDLYVWYIILVAAISVKSHIPDIFPDI